MRYGETESSTLVATASIKSFVFPFFGKKTLLKSSEIEGVSNFEITEFFSSEIDVEHVRTDFHRIRNVSLDDGIDFHPARNLLRSGHGIRADGFRSGFIYENFAHEGFRFIGKMGVFAYFSRSRNETPATVERIEQMGFCEPRLFRSGNRLALNDEFGVFRQFEIGGRSRDSRRIEILSQFDARMNAAEFISSRRPVLEKFVETPYRPHSLNVSIGIEINGYLLRSVWRSGKLRGYSHGHVVLVRNVRPNRAKKIGRVLSGAFTMRNNAVEERFPTGIFQVARSVLMIHTERLFRYLYKYFSKRQKKARPSGRTFSNETGYNFLPEISSLVWAMKSATDMTVCSPVLRERTETVFSVISFSPMTSA